MIPVRTAIDRRFGGQQIVTATGSPLWLMPSRRRNAPWAPVRVPRQHDVEAPGPVVTTELQPLIETPFGSVSTPETRAKSRSLPSAS